MMVENERVMVGMVIDMLPDKWAEDEGNA